MSSTAFIELGLAVDLFEKGAKHSRRARSGMVGQQLFCAMHNLTVRAQAILSKLRDKAFQVYAQFRGGNSTFPTAWHPSTKSRLEWGAGDDDSADELAIFGGQTRVLVSKLLNNLSPNWDQIPPISKSLAIKSTDASSATAEADMKDSSKSVDASMQDVHPSLVEYMSLFPPSAFAPGFNHYPDIDSQQSSLEHAMMNGPSAFPQISIPTKFSDYSYPPLPLGRPLPLRQSQSQGQQAQSRQQQYQNMAASSSSSAAVAGTFPYELSPSPFDVAQNGSAYSIPTPSSADSPGTPGSGDIGDLGMMMNGDSGMDEQWMSFLRDSGILSQDTGVGLAVT